jgi:hypothetical protein
MPAFSFEKIAPPAERESGGPIVATVRRGALMRIIERLTPARLQKSEKSQRKDGKQN